MIITLTGEEVTEALQDKRTKIAAKIISISKDGNNKAQAELPALSASLVRVNEMLQSVVSHRTYEIVEYVTAQPASDAARQLITDELRPGGRIHSVRRPEDLE